MHSPLTRFSRTQLSYLIVGAAVLGVPVAASADWCETSPGSQVFTDVNCDKQDYEIRHGRKPVTQRPGSTKPAGRSLRDRLLDARKEDAARSAQADEVADRITDASRRAEDALRRGAEATDAESRAKARRDYDKAMKDLTKAYDDAAAATSTGRAEILSLKQQAIAGLQNQAARVFRPAEPTQTSAVAPRSAPNPDIFEICAPETTRPRLQTCYQVPRRGLSCTKVHKDELGNEVWQDRQEWCESIDVLERRNDHFNRLDAAREPSSPQSAAVADLPARCKSQLNALLDGAQKKDGGKAHAAYAALRGQCEEGIRKLAQAANARLPERRLNSRASAALAEAMSQQPGQSTFGERSGSSNGGSRQATNTAPSYDVDEVIDLGIGILSLLNGAAGLQASRPGRNAPIPAVKQPTSTYGQGAPPPYKAPRNRPSDITGTR